MTDIVDETVTEDAIAPFTEGEREIAYRSEAAPSVALPGGRPALVAPSAATGRRKEAIARVRIFPGTGQWKINGRTLGEYFPRETHRIRVEEPLRAAVKQVVDHFGGLDIFVNNAGAGRMPLDPMSTRPTAGGRLSRFGRAIVPSWVSRTSVAVASMPRSRATGTPRSVTTISAPSRARMIQSLRCARSSVTARRSGAR